ncbi:ATP-grasp domain-containing protein [Haloplasma contractile]|uniref:DNA polymerase III subunit beta protein n=1 Tax=Haloplasma contractile SSD-17B TaxID=1033810 RepID=U2E8A4_9MOLU|nr:ATP-grasp domain-containing protein [Haloplasma contractile]ERJ11121.1 DNA polymerase III subunit beta protein [Haloplasma contractile SSD-17B]
MKTIIFIGTQKSGSSREAIKAADRLGYYTILLTDKEKQIRQREEYPDVHLMKLCNIDDYDELKSIIKKFEFKGLDIKTVISFVDSHCYMACRLADFFGLGRFTTDAVFKMENKVKSRNAMSDTPYAPMFKVLNTDQTYNKESLKDFLPGIIKSPSSTGSKDVYKIEDFNTFTSKFDHLKSKYPGESVIIEEYLEGPQSLIEVVVVDGDVNIIGVVEQEISHINDRFIITGYYLAVEMTKISYEEIKNVVTEITRAHGMENGACHIEMRYVNGTWKLIEINPRISGGGMNKLIEAGLGLNLVEETLKFALNEHYDLGPKIKRPVYLQYTTVQEEGTLERVTGKNRAKRSKGVLHVYVKPRKGNTIMLPRSMGHRYAYVLATGEHEVETIENAKSAIREIEFIVDKEDEKNS